MLDMSEVVRDPDLAAPQSFTILRSTGQWVAGGFQSTTTPIVMRGPVQVASNKEIAMLAESDRISAVMAFHSTVPIQMTSATQSVPSTHGEVPAPVTPGSVYQLSAAPPGGFGILVVDGTFVTQGIDYTLTGQVIVLLGATDPDAALYFTWIAETRQGTSASDILVYGDEQYRVLSVWHDPGAGFWKALGTRMAAA